MAEYIGTVILFSFVPVLTAFILMIIGRSSLKNILKKERECSIKTTAKIVEIKELKHPTGTGRHRNNCVYTYHPVLEYTIGERSYKNAYTYGATKESYYTIGATKEICCNPGNKNIFFLKDDLASKKRAKHMIIAGIIIMIIVAIFVILSVVQYNYLYT